MKERFELIKRNTQEIITEDELKKLLKEKKHPVSYVGIAPTGTPHIGYYRSIAKQLDLVEAGCRHIVLIADLHAYLDDQKSPWSTLSARAEIYKNCLQLLGLKGKNIKYVIGSSFQREKYLMEVLRIAPFITVKRGLRAASEVCRMENPKVSELFYPLMQSLDCWALDVDIACGGMDQRHVHMLAREFLPKLGHKKPVAVHTPLGIGLSGSGKMSASETLGKLELFAGPDEIKNKISQAFCPEGIVEDNPILEYCQFIIFPKIRRFEIQRDKKYGGDIVLRDYNSLEKQFKDKKIHPADLKTATAQYLTDILAPIRKYWSRNSALVKRAYGN